MCLSFVFFKYVSCAESGAYFRAAELASQALYMYVYSSRVADVIPQSPNVVHYIRAGYYSSRVFRKKVQQGIFLRSQTELLVVKVNFLSGGYEAYPCNRKRRLAFEDFILSTTSCMSKGLVM